MDACEPHLDIFEICTEEQNFLTRINSNGFQGRSVSSDPVHKSEIGNWLAIRDDGVAARIVAGMTPDQNVDRVKPFWNVWIFPRMPFGGINEVMIAGRLAFHGNQHPRPN